MTEKELHKIFCDNIKKLRARSRLSQIEVAKKAGISINFVNDLELGKKWASPQTMLKLAKVFSVEAYELLKPSCLIPDNLPGILEKYCETVCLAAEHARTDIMQDYID